MGNSKRHRTDFVSSSECARRDRRDGDPEIRGSPGPGERALRTRDQVVQLRSQSFDTHSESAEVATISATHEHKRLVTRRLFISSDSSPIAEWGLLGMFLDPSLEDWL